MNKEIRYNCCDTVKQVKKELERLEKSSIEELYEYLLQHIVSTARSYFSSHRCKAVSSEKFTEKRFCRCLVSLNQANSQCAKCKYSNQYRFTTDSIIPLEYEIDVTQDSKDGIGGIDLIFKYTSNYYLCEVKPDYNTNSIVHMLYEILTYSKLLEKSKDVFNDFLKSKGYTFTFGDCQLAIMYFKNSKQERQMEQYGDRFKNILKKFNVAIFRAHIENRKVNIEKVN